MQNYPQRVRGNILPLSVAGTLPEAFEEWRFTEDTRDHEEPIETCGLCGQEHLRYHFEIENVFTEATLWVGSHCILQFGLSVFENGKRLSSHATKKKLDRLTDKMRLDACVRALTVLANKEGAQNLKGALAYYKLNKVLTPNYAALVLWRLNERGIDHSPSFFKVTLRRDQHKADLKKMNPRMFGFIWKALTAAQRRTALGMGWKDPTSPSG